MNGHIPPSHNSPKEWMRLVATAVNPILKQAVYDLAQFSYVGNANKVAKVNPGATKLELLADATGGSSSYTVESRSATYGETATSGEKVILCSGTFTANLPTAVGNTAKLNFKLVAAGTLTIDGSGAETIDGAATAAVSAVNTTVTLISDNANWQII